MAEQAESITALSLPYWAFRTVSLTRRTYRSARRPLTLTRLWRTVIPNLTRPVFIVGAPRSGTTFLGACTASLPEVSYHFEPVATKAAARYVYEKRWRFGRARRFYRNVYAWLMRVHLDGDLVFAEKTPRNAFIIPFLRRSFPGARFLHIIRDGRDAALSLSRRPWLQRAQRDSGRREPGGYRYGPFARFWVEPARIPEFQATSDIHRCIWSWRRHTESALEAAADLPAEQYCEVRYEAIVADSRREADRLLDFLRIGNAASRQAFRKAMAGARPDSVAAWRRELSAEELQCIQAEAGHLLRRLGYED